MYGLIKEGSMHHNITLIGCDKTIGWYDVIRLLGRYSIYTWTWNVKREREKSNKRFSILCIPYRRERDVNVKREFMTCDRETRAWNRSLRFFTFTHSIHGRGTKLRGPLSMREAAEKLIKSITNALYCMNSLLNSTGTQTLKTVLL